MKKFFVAAGTIVCTVGIAGDECRNITASLQTYTYITCPGDNPNVTSSISETKRFSGTVACKFNEPSYSETSEGVTVTVTTVSKDLTTAIAAPLTYLVARVHYLRPAAESAIASAHVENAAERAVASADARALIQRYHRSSSTLKAMALN